MMDLVYQLIQHRMMKQPTTCTHRETGDETTYNMYTQRETGDETTYNMYTQRETGDETTYNMYTQRDR